jgi:hypothetical protein
MIGLTLSRNAHIRAKKKKEEQNCELSNGHRKVAV